MQRSQPFGRALAMMAALAAAASMPPSLAQAARADIGPYESRGKGRGKSFVGSGRPGAGMAAIRGARKLRNVKRHRKACKG